MLRQPGSALKPFAYGEALKDGLTPASVLPDLTATFDAAAGGYAPKNYDGLEHGPVRLREALANSFNIPAVRVAERLGPERVLQTFRNAGLSSLGQGASHYGLGLVLGDGEVSPWAVARAYAGLSRGGVLRPLRIIRHAWRADGSEIPLRDELAPRRFLPEIDAHLITSILSDNTARSRAFGLDSVLRLPFKVAAKTGTSKGYSDNWAVGYTRERTVAAWAGNFNGAAMVEVSGITGAGPILNGVLRAAMKGVHPQDLFDASTLEHGRICPLSGELAGPDCPNSMDEVFAPGTAPRQTCAMHHHLSAGLPASLAARCHRLADAKGRLVVWGPRYAAWAQEKGLTRDAQLAAVCAGLARPGAAPASSPKSADPAPVSAQILSPSSGDVFRLDPDLPADVQTIPLRVLADAAGGTLQVSVDGESVLELAPPFTGRLPATAGRHLLRVLRQDGSAIGEVAYFVRAR
jgi:penicillin-binding protein 1C